MALKRGQNVGDRYIKHTTEQEILELMITGTAETALTADQALAR
jgi:simple sugar transport system ATP-binding protein